jgi:hypothetical protein
MGSTDSQITQLLALLEEEVNSLATRHDWQGLEHEAVHTTINAEDQGAIETLDLGFRFLRNNTIWDYTDRLPVLGPLSGKQWQAIKAILANGPRYYFRFRGNHLIVNPIPAAGHVWKFEYQSKYAILAADGVTLKEFFTADTDTFILPDDLHLLGLRWRWMREKGLDYGELFNAYEYQVKDAMGRDGGAPVLSMDGDRKETRPGIFVPNGNWTVP